MYSIKQFLDDIKFTVVIALTLFPPVFIMVFDLPGWLWFLWCGWMALFTYANSPGVRRAVKRAKRRAQRRSKRFTTFSIDEDIIKSADSLDD